MNNRGVIRHLGFDNLCKMVNIDWLKPLNMSHKIEQRGININAFDTY